MMGKQQERTADLARPGCGAGGSGRLIHQSVLDPDGGTHGVSHLGRKWRVLLCRMESSLANPGSLGGNEGTVTM